MGVPSKTSLLDGIRIPAELRALPRCDLRRLADELRTELIDVVSVTGGHLGSSLGVVELTVALHYVFDTPNDKLIWDVGHQAYPHKILTGRRSRMRTLRQGGGLSGLPSAPKANSIPSARRIRLPPFRRRLALLSRATCRARRTMSWP